MRQIVLLPFLIVVILLIQSCKDEELIYAPQGYAYLQHTAFSIDTSQWNTNNKNIYYTVTMQNIGTLNAKVIRTQLIYQEPTSNELTTRYLKWLNPDSSNVEIPPGGTVTYTVNDTVTYRDSVLFWKLSYNSNPANNVP
jgi:hypothetical protein